LLVYKNWLPFVIAAVDRVINKVSL